MSELSLSLTEVQLSSARSLTFLPVSTAAGEKWDNSAEFSDFGYLKSINSIFRFDAIEGATYTISSFSSVDPLWLGIYDDQGEKIIINNESDDPVAGDVKFDVIYDWVAPYTGMYYVDAAWTNWFKQENTSIFLSIYEDIGTVTSNNLTVSDATLSHLALLGITVEQANEFLLSHATEPWTIFNTAKQHGVTTLMLSEITGFSTDIISGYFASYGIDATELNSNSMNPDDDSSAGKRDLLSPDMVSLANVISFNENTGVLSTAALRESITSFIGLEVYNSRFEPNNFKGSEDGVFTPEELGGITHLGNIPATRENLESLFYGTAINAYRNFSFEEFADLSLNNNGDPNETRELEIAAYSSSTNNPLISNDTDLAFQVQNVGISGWVSVDGNDVPPFFDGILIFT
ncbi:MAG: hypothetical protein KDF59_08510 [Nitrosomonas sp.]|nr:hypothetical protein [Nitrosomonas sp.]